MQIQFDPNSIDQTEAAIILGMVIVAVVKGCHAKGDTLADVKAGLADLLDHTWTEVVGAKEPKGD